MLAYNKQKVYRLQYKGLKLKDSHIFFIHIYSKVLLFVQIPDECSTLTETVQYISDFLSQS